MTVGAREFHLEEYKHLKQQISSLIDKVVTVVQYVLGGSAAIYAWLITNHAIDSEGIWIPVLLSLFGGLMMINIAWRIHAIRQYLNILENYLHNPSEESLPLLPVKVPRGQTVSGWEQFRAQSRLRAVWEWITIGLFLLVFVLTLALATGRLKVPPPPPSRPTASQAR